ncbi:hypothetical protein ABK040_008672 [Willaertia magna]
MDVGVMMAQKDKAVKGLTGGIEFLFKKYKVEYFKGEGSIVNKNEVLVKGLDEKEERVTTDNIVIATGFEAIPLLFLPFDEKVVLSSTSALFLQKVLEKMIIN